MPATLKTKWRERRPNFDKHLQDLTQNDNLLNTRRTKPLNTRRTPNGNFISDKHIYSENVSSVKSRFSLMIPT